MVKRMKLWVVGAFLLAIGGTVVASNMAFKFVPNWNEGGTNKTHSLSLPLINNYVNSKDLFDDINASGCSASSVTRVNTNGTAQNYIGIGSGFAFNKQEGLLIKVNGAGCTSLVVVGSHDPSFVYTFALGGSAQYLTSIPYHTTAANAKDAYDSISSCNLVSRINRNQTRTNFIGIGSGFPVVIGDAYFIKVTTPGTTWTPPHY